MPLPLKLASRTLSLATLAALATTITACIAAVGSPTAAVPFDAAGKCADYCSKMGLTLNAVVVMANTVGCVCTPTGHGTTAAVEGGSAAAGMATLLAQQQQQQAAAQASHH